MARNVTMGNILSQLRWLKPSLWEATKSLSKASLGLGALFFGMYWMGYFLTPEEQHLAQKYHVSQDAVFIAPKPHRCDFDDAPVGNKHCHFDRKEAIERDDQGNIASVSVTGRKCRNSWGSCGLRRKEELPPIFGYSMIRKTIFISCGQFTDAERRLGKRIAEMVRELTDLEPFFAEEVQVSTRKTS